MSLLVLVGCETTALRSTLHPAALYVNDENYVDHRAQQRHFVSSGGDIAYLDVGSGPVLVLLHGVPSSSWLYRNMIAALQNDFRVIAPDFLGFGSSDKPDSTGNNYTTAAQSQYLGELLDSLKLREYSLLFHDMGGVVAWDLLQQRQDEVSNLIVLNTIISETGFNHPSMKKGFLVEQITAAFGNALTSRLAVQSTFRNMGLNTTERMNENICYGYVKPMREGGNKALYEFFTSFNPTFFTQLAANVQGLSNYQGNVLVLWGGEDKVLTTRQIPILQDVIGFADENIVIYPHNSHFLQEEIPELLSQRIRRFLQ